MMPQELKSSILQLAVQGRLVEQRPEEGTAEELYRQIQEEKQRLIKEGKIKKEKPLPEITEDEVPFDIPESWKWVRLGNAFCTEMGQSPKGSSVSEIGNGMEFHQGKVHFGEKYLLLSPQKTSIPSKIAKPNSVLLCVRAPVGKVNITSRKICIGRGLCSIKPVAEMHVDFVYYLLTTFEKTFIRQATGTTFIAITGEIVKKQPIPLPPLAEQKRIVAKIEELLPYIDRYEKAWSKLEDFNKRFPGDMQKSVLQMAIQGKLVEQRPEEGTGEELYRQIQAEKQSLIKSGKIKKEKPLPEISEDEIPFDIPVNWIWVRFSEIAEFLNGDRGINYPKRSEYVTNGVPWINTGHITADGFLDTSTMNYITEEKYNSLRNGKIKSGDLVYCLRGATFGKVARVEPYPKGAIASSLMIIRMISRDLREYILTYLKSPLAYQQLHLYNNGSAQPNLAAKDVAKYLIPLPPLAEQKRIVQKLEQILPLCERLK